MTQPTTNFGPRIAALHQWYADTVLAVRLTPERERRWLAFFKQGFTEDDLRRVILYLRTEIGKGKRNHGALKLENLLKYSDEDGNFSDFENDLALAKAGILRGGRVAPLPNAERETRKAEPAPAQPEKAPAYVPMPGVEPGESLSEMLKKWRKDA
jgi:hypothetical protein